MEGQNTSEDRVGRDRTLETIRCDRTLETIGQRGTGR